MATTPGRRIINELGGIRGSRDEFGETFKTPGRRPVPPNHFPRLDFAQKMVKLAS